MKRICEKVCLPKRINEIISVVGLKKRGICDALKLCEIIIRNGKRYSDAHGYVPLAAKYLQRAFGCSYNDVLFPLKKHNIIQAKCSTFSGKETYQPGKSCKYYRISPELLEQEFEVYDIKVKGTTNDVLLKVGTEWFNKRILFDDFDALKLDISNLIEESERYAASIDVSGFLLDDAISAKCFEVNDRITGFSGPVSLSTCLDRARENGGVVIKDGHNYYVDSIDDFITQKRKNILFAYKHSIHELASKNYYAGRNLTNSRLDHNFTSISKVLLNIIKETNNLVEIDLCNSQFAFLANWINGNPEYQDSSDFKIFYKQAGNGTLYEFIKEKLDLPHRDAAKAIMMEIAFSSYKHGTENKCRFKELFPSVSKFIEEFKKYARTNDTPNGEGAFAVTLQRMESDVFIDTLYYQLKKMGYWVITRHDSLVIKKEDESAIRLFLEETFERMQLQCTLK